MGKKRRRQQNDDGGNRTEKKRQLVEDEMPEGVHHYEHLTEVPWDIAK
jgi:hypothetical protein